MHTHARETVTCVIEGKTWALFAKRRRIWKDPGRTRAADSFLAQGPPETPSGKQH